MTFDLSTLLIIAVLVSAVAGCLLLVTWLQSRGHRALGLWALAFAMGALGIGLIAARGHIADVWSITTANAILAASYGVMWAGARSFEGRATPMPAILAGALIWLLACQFDRFYSATSARVALMSAIIAAYSLLGAMEFWRGRSEALASRWPLILLLTANGLVFLIRIPLADNAPLSIEYGEVGFNWFSFIVFESIFYTFCVAYMFGGVAKERIAAWYRRASLVDPLTGASNRRDFLQRCEALLRRTAFDRASSVLLLFDLDNFKLVNDTFGHHSGDQVLRSFTELATSMLRPNDVFGRLGGEEFGALIPHATIDEGRDIAERIRAQAEIALRQLAGDHIGVTVSVGVAVSAETHQELSALLMAADEALYRAKANGRNRVEWAQARPSMRLRSSTAA